MESTALLAYLKRVFWTIVICAPWSSNGVRHPSYISPWHFMDVSTISTLSVRWNHGFGETPIYADVQVRSNDTNFIYPGISSGFITNNAQMRGGVIFWYNNTHVELHGPEQKNLVSPTFIIFTGQVGYNTGNAERLTSGYVRVRLWRQSDLSPPTYTVPAFSIASLQAYQVNHSLGVVPVFTVVQLQLTGLTPTGWFSQAQGSDTECQSNGGGTIYGVSSSDLRIWTYTSVFSFCEGWGAIRTSSNCEYFTANVTIRMWACLESDIMFENSVPHSIQSDASSHEMNITSPFNHDKDLIVVRVESTTGSLPGYYFDGIGAAMVDTTSVDTGYYLGGLVFATNNATQILRMWHPVFHLSSLYVRCIARASTGNCVTGANVHVVIYKGMTTIYTPVLTYAHVVSHTACFYEFACDDPYIHLEGDLTSSLIGGVWTGNLPSCVISTTPPVTTTTTTPATTTTVPGTTTSAIATTTVAAVTTFEPVSVVCHNLSASTPEAIKEAIEIAEEISKNLTIEAKATGAYKRTLVCAQDTRKSALYVGVVGYVVMGIVFGFIFFLDGINLVQYCVDSK